MYEETFASRLKKAREETGLTQRDVTKETGIPQSTLANYETGRTQPDIETLGILIDFYEVNADWILGTGIKKETFSQSQTFKAGTKKKE